MYYLWSGYDAASQLPLPRELWNKVTLLLDIMVVRQRLYRLALIQYRRFELIMDQLMPAWWSVWSFTKRWMDQIQYRRFDLINVRQLQYGIPISPRIPITLVLWGLGGASYHQGNGDPQPYISSDIGIGIPIIGDSPYPYYTRLKRRRPQPRARYSSHKYVSWFFIVRQGSEGTHFYLGRGQINIQEELDGVVRNKVIQDNIATKMRKEAGV